MADAKVSFIKFCTLNTEIMAVLGNRITPDRVPDGQTQPNARVIQVTAPQRYLLSGGSAGRKIKLQVDVYGASTAETDNATQVLQDALSGYKGMLGELNAGYVFVKDVNGDWNEAARDTHRILELEIGTND